jgi:hypothetical protein
VLVERAEPQRQVLLTRAQVEADTQVVELLVPVAQA